MPRVDINRQAPIVSSHEIVVAAPPQQVWDAHTRIRDWPEWNQGITRAAIAGQLEVGASFDWETAGMAITSTVRELIPGKRIVWDGTVGGILGIHAWTFTPHNGGTLVRTDESWEGVRPTAGRQSCAMRSTPP